MDENRTTILPKDMRLRLVVIGILISLFIITVVIMVFSYQNSILMKNIARKTNSTKIQNAFSGISIRGKAAIVYDLATHKILFAKNAEAQLPLASVTKLLTIYSAVKYLGIGADIPITRADVLVYGDSGFDPGEIFKLGTLARLTLAASVNDGAAAIARTTALYVKKNVPNLLSSVADAAGLVQMYTLNGSGLDSNASVSGGYGSPYDVALLAGKLIIEAPSIVSATTKPIVTAVSLDGISHTKRNTNPDVTKIAGILLSKTGYTTLAGGNLVVVFDASFEHPIAVVVLGSTEKGRFQDVQKLIDATRAYLAGIPLRV